MISKTRMSKTSGHTHWSRQWRIVYKFQVEFLGFLYGFQWKNLLHQFIPNSSGFIHITGQIFPTGCSKESNKFWAIYSKSLTWFFRPFWRGWFLYYYATIWGDRSRRKKRSPRTIPLLLLLERFPTSKPLNHLDVSENSGKVFPPNHPFVHRVFHDFHHPFWGKHPYCWKHPFFRLDPEKSPKKRWFFLRNGYLGWWSPGSSGWVQANLPLFFVGFLTKKNKAPTGSIGSPSNFWKVWMKFTSAKCSSEKNWMFKRVCPHILGKMLRLPWNTCVDSDSNFAGFWRNLHIITSSSMLGSVFDSPDVNSHEFSCVSKKKAIWRGGWLELMSF